MEAAILNPATQLARLLYVTFIHASCTTLNISEDCRLVKAQWRKSDTVASIAIALSIINGREVVPSHPAVQLQCRKKL